MTVKHVLLKKVLPALAGAAFRRAGTMLAAYLVARGLPPDGVEQFFALTAGAIGVAGDLFFDWQARSKAKDDGVREGLFAAGVPPEEHWRVAGER